MLLCFGALTQSARPILPKGISGNQPNLSVRGLQAPALETNVTSEIASLVAEQVQAALAAARGHGNDPGPGPDTEDAGETPGGQPGVGDPSSEYTNPKFPSSGPAGEHALLQINTKKKISDKTKAADSEKTPTTTKKAAKTKAVVTEKTPAMDAAGYEGHRGSEIQL